MALEVLVGSSDPFLTTTAAVKAAMGIPSSSTQDDAAISDAILRASRQAETLVGYPLSAARYLETLEGYGTRRLMLSRTPVRAVDALLRGTDSGDHDVIFSSEFALNRDAGFLERNIGWAWTVPASRLLEPTPQPFQEFPWWRAEYVAGYTLGGIDTGSALWSTEKGTTSTGRTLPEDIELAIIRQAARNIQSEGEDSGPVSRRKIGDLQVEYAGRDADSKRGAEAHGTAGLAADLAAYVRVV